jgi:GntR family transcriptional regulator
VARTDEPDGLPRRLPGGPKGQALREILEGLVASLPAGSALPSERLLAARYDLARMTVRTEVDRLAAAGSVYRLHGRGTFVAEPRVAQDVLFSSFTEDMRARGFEPGSVVLAQEIIEATSFLAGALQIAPGAPVAHVERLRTADGRPMALERAHLPADRFPGVAEADFEAGSLFDVLAGYGVWLHEARQRVLGVTLSGEEAELLGVEEGQAGLLFRTLARDAEGTPAYFASSLFRSDRYEIDLTQTRPRESR